MTNLIIGMGNVGTALYKVLKESDPTIQTMDIKSQEVKTPVGIMHICFPYDSIFEKYVSNYISIFKPKITVIHSTIPVGTTRRLINITKARIAHSPVVGQHDALEKGLKTFEKWIGPSSHTVGMRLAKYFKKAGLKPKIKSSPEVTELAKLLSTYRYGLSIARAQEEAKICQQIDLNFAEVSTEFIRMYNKGYKELGIKEVMQPNTFPGIIGGHCILPNLDLLEQQYPDLIFPKAIKESNVKTIHEAD